MSDEAYGAVLPFIKIEGDKAIYGGPVPDEIEWVERPMQGPHLEIDRRYHELLCEPTELVVYIQDVNHYKPSNLSEFSRSVFHKADG